MVQNRIFPPGLIMGTDSVRIIIDYSPATLRTLGANMHIEGVADVPTLIAVLTSLTNKIALDGLEASRMLVGGGGGEPCPDDGGGDEGQKESKDGNTKED